MKKQGLLTPIKINDRVIANRAVVAPMCQYSANEGLPSPWHFGHLHQLAISGAGILMLESTAVTMAGRITYHDLTISSDEHVVALAKLLDHLRYVSDITVGLQISHAGRKGSAYPPWIKSGQSLTEEDKAWQTYSSSPIARTEGWPIPQAFSLSELKQLAADFSVAASRANRAGFDAIEVHMAHGYLLHQFLSPISNHRSDRYGGTLSSRCLFPLEVADKVRKQWPKEKILGARLTGNDWLDNGWTIDDCIFLSQRLKEIGFDYVCISSGGILPKTNLKFTPGYQIHLAKAVKDATSLVTRTAGMITTPKQADEIIKSGDADLVAIGREFVRNPYFMNHAERELGGTPKVPPQYERILSTS